MYILTDATFCLDIIKITMWSEPPKKFLLFNHLNIYLAIDFKSTIQIREQNNWFN